jgi:hypothetical protein
VCSILCRLYYELNDYLMVYTLLGIARVRGYTYVHTYVHTYMHRFLYRPRPTFNAWGRMQSDNIIFIYTDIIQIICFFQTTNTISFLFSLFGTGMVIKKFGLTATLIAFPALMLVCTALVWVSPNIWVRECA